MKEGSSTIPLRELQGEDNDMKVLWFTGVVPGKFSECMGNTRSVIQGWIPSLIDALGRFAPGIDLTVAFSWRSETSKVIDGVRYVALGEQTSRGRVRKEFVGAVGKCVRAVNPDLIHLHGSENIYPALPRDIWNGVPVLFVTGIVGVVGYVPSYYMEGSFCRICLTTLITLVCLSLAGVYIIMNHQERVVLLKLFLATKSKTIQFVRLG